MMRKTILLLLLTLSLLEAQTFTKRGILGVWELSSKDMKSYTTFGTESSSKWGSVYTLIFNRHGLVKNKTTGAVYNYEIINHKLKIYKTHTYSNNYKVKDKRHYDLWRTTSSYEGCMLAKIEVKKLSGIYKKKKPYKWCKVAEFPQTVEYTTQDFKF
jgi:hypothetical protein